MARALTIISVEKASPSGRRVEIPEGALQGLYLVIQPSGAKSWACRYRLDGKTRKYTIGAFPKVDLVNARKLAHDAVTAIGEGRDPGVERPYSPRCGVGPPEFCTSEGRDDYCRDVLWLRGVDLRAG